MKGRAVLFVLLSRIKGIAGDFRAIFPDRETMERRMSATEIATRHFSAALIEAETAGLDVDGVCRALLSLVVARYLESRPVSDVQSELRFVADNCDPETDFMFMRP